MTATAPDPITEFRATRRVEFADTDLGGIVHFARFFVFMETAEHELLRSLGTSVHVTDPDGRVIGWPRVEAHCEYLAPLRFGDLVEIVLRVARKGERSMTYEAELSAGGRLRARGRMSSVCCVLNDPARRGAGAGPKLIPRFPTARQPMYTPVPLAVLQRLHHRSSSMVCRPSPEDPRPCTLRPSGGSPPSA